MKTFGATLFLFIMLMLSGCVGSPIHSTAKYNSVQSLIKTNNGDLLNLEIRMSKKTVKNIMAQPERSEGYQWGSVWLYRTAMTSGVYGTLDSDFTPIVFDKRGTLIGWGRNFFMEQVKKYEVTLK